MQPTRSPRRSRLGGWWLALLALCAFDLQGLQHYAPRMLLGASLCSARAEGPSGTPKGLGLQDKVCGLCCASPGVVPVPPARQGLAAVHATGVSVVARWASVPRIFRAWSASRPRGPPAVRA